MPDNLNDPKTPCPQCKSLVPAGNKFCEVCGAIMPVQRTCPICRTPVDLGMKFCEQCGSPLHSATVAPQATPVPPSPPMQISKITVSVEPVSVSEPEPKPVGQKNDAEKPLTYIPPADEKSAPSSSLPAEKPAGVDKSQPVSPVKPSAPAMGLADNKKIIIGAVIGIVLLLIIALVALPALNSKSATTASPASVPAVSSSPSSILNPSVTTSPADSKGSTASSTGTGSGAVSMVPGPTQRMPEETNVIVTADKDVITGAITVQIAGGPGRSVIKEVRGTVYRGDGETSAGIINPALRSEEVVIPGSKGTDRVVVTVVLYSGDQYVVMDKLMTFRARG